MAQGVDRGMFTDVYLQGIAEDISFEWHRLGILLGIKTNVLDKLKADNPRSMEVYITKMLIKWRDKRNSFSSDVVDELRNDLKTAGRTDLSDTIAKDYSKYLASGQDIDELTQLTCDMSIEPITEEIFQKVAKNVGHDWRVLGLKLGLSDVALDHLETDHPNSITDCIMAMLRKWRGDPVTKTSMKVLKTALKCINKHSLAEFIDAQSDSNAVQEESYLRICVKPTDTVCQYWTSGKDESQPQPAVRESSGITSVDSGDAASSNQVSDEHQNPGLWTRFTTYISSWMSHLFLGNAQHKQDAQ